MSIRRGEVYKIDLSPTVGAEMKFEHPAVVVSNDMINEAASVVIVCPITSGARSSPIHIALKRGEGGLTMDCIAHCGQVRAVDKARLTARWGTLPSERMDEIGRGLRLALSL